MSEVPPSSLTGSERLFLALLLPRPDVRSIGTQDVRWNDFLRLVDELGLSPYLSHVLQQDALGLPDSVRERILDGGRANAMRQLLRHATLRRVADGLDKARIPFIVVKGMALAYVAYPNPYCRSMSDIDLLVSPAELSRAGAAARDAGLVESRLSFRQDCPVFSSPDRLVHVEFHALLPSMEEFGVESASLWERSIPADLGGIGARVLHPEDCLQHLCLHIGAHHHYLSRLKELVDFRFYLEKHGAETDWQAVSDTSRRIGSSAWVYLTLWLAQELLGAPVPAAFFQSCAAPRRLTELSRLATQHLLSAPALPMTSTLVEVGVSRSFKEFWSALRRHGTSVGPQGKDGSTVQEAKPLGPIDYFGLVFRRVAALIRAGAFQSSAWHAAADYQESRTHLLNLMDNEAHAPPPHPPAA